MSAFAAHIRFAVRSLRRSPGLAAVAVLCLAMGIGAVTTMGQVVDTLLLQPPPGIRAPREVARLRFTVVQPGTAPVTAPGLLALGPGVSYADYRTLRDRMHGIRALAGYHIATLSLGRGAEARPARTAFVTGTFFPLLGVRPAFGRLVAHDALDTMSAPPPAVVSWALWQSQFGGDSSILGRTITLGTSTYAVAGVTPRGFRGVVRLESTDIWVPIGAAVPEMFRGSRERFVNRSTNFIHVLCRLPPHAAVRGVATQAATLQNALFTARFGPMMGRHRVVATLAPLIPGLGVAKTGDGSLVLWLAAAAVLVLIIACANVAGLLLARAADRRPEVAIRLALGASRTQLAQLFASEALVLSVAAAALALVLCRVGNTAIRAFLLPELHLPSSAFDARVVAIAAVATVATGLACSLSPTLHVWRDDIAPAVADAPPPGRGGPARTRRGLLVAQVSLALSLVSGAVLFLASWRNVHAIRLGFEPAHVVVARMDLQREGYSAAETRAAFTAMLADVRALPEVRAASLATHLPFVGVLGNPIEVPGVEPALIRRAGRSPIGPELSDVSPGYFAVMRTPLRRGRVFTEADRAGTKPVAIVNERMARTLWPAGNAIGKCIIIRLWAPGTPQTACSRIVGIVADTRTTSPLETPDLQVYAPLAQRPDAVTAYLAVRTRRDPRALVAPVRRAMQSATDGLPFADVRPFGDYLAPTLRPWRLGAAVFAAAGALALALSAVGLYGVFTHAVCRRTREMGVRVALGATHGNVVRLVLREGAWLFACGAAIGLPLALLEGRLFESLLVGVSAASPTVLALSAGVVLGVSLLAVVLPAARAAGVEPAVALREE